MLGDQKRCSLNLLSAWRSPALEMGAAASSDLRGTSFPWLPNPASTVRQEKCSPSPSQCALLPWLSLGSPVYKIRGKSCGLSCQFRPLDPWKASPFRSPWILEASGQSIMGRKKRSCEDSGCSGKLSAQLTVLPWLDNTAWCS